MVWRLYPFAIVLGLVAGSGVAALVLVLGLSFFGGVDGDVITQPTGFLVATLVGSIAAPFSAGWVTARFAFGEELINTFATGAVLVALGISGYFEPPVHEVPDWLDWSSVGLALPLCVAAGLLYRGRTSAT